MAGGQWGFVAVKYPAGGREEVLSLAGDTIY